MKLFLMRCGILALAAIAAYYLVFMPFALFGKWRPSLSNPVQLASFVGVGLVLNLIGLATSRRLLRSGIIAASLFFLISAASALAYSDSNDGLDPLWTVLISTAFPILNALIGARALDYVDEHES